MADNEYKLIIEIPPQEEDNSTTAPAPNGQSNPKESAKDKQSDGKKAALKTIAAINVGVSLVDRIASGYVNTTTLRTGFEEQQAKYQMIQGATKRLVSIGSAVITGALVGNAPGAAIGAMVALTGQMIDIGNTAAQVSLQRNVENTQIFLNNIRMGAGANRGNRE